MDNKQRHVNAGITFKQFCIGCLIYFIIGVLSYLSATGYVMQNKIKWYNEKIKKHQELEIASLKVGDDFRVARERETIEHYQELLKQQ